MGYYPAAVIINDTDAHTGRFGKVVALQDSVIATIVSDTISGDLKSWVSLQASHYQAEQ